MGATTVSGRLDPALIQRAIRVHYEDFRRCYQTGLDSNPKLEGRVSARFTITPDGTVESVSDYDSDLPDPDVIACVFREFAEICFPMPEGRPVTVVYPMMLIPE
ncbi:MAG TPA: AgmX/PglI C-terminal domain-containing protein [Polyangiaceae bacterium]|jgi:hypothetical protein|nr:AgmX/PglI C-terminal domain-containing protein [Polyangiaceae bacterium]